MSKDNFQSCGICGPTTRPQRVYGPRIVKIKGQDKVVMLCGEHLNDQTLIIERTDVTELKKVANEKKLTQKVWFDLKLKNAPKTCECGCKGKLSVPDGMSPRTIVAHIFAKAIFKSVACHPFNFFYATWQHHTDYDNKTWPEKMNLPIWDKIQERVYAVIQDMDEGELKKLPDMLRKLRNENINNQNQ